MRNVLFFRAMKKFAGVLAAAISIATDLAFAAPAENKSPGLAVTFTTEKNSDVTSTANVQLYVPDREVATPFLPAGKFKALWNGFVAVDLRGDYSFQAELNGTLKLEINGQTVLDTMTNGLSDISKPIRLGKGGTNTIAATFTSPAEGGAFIRLLWKPKDSFVQPIPGGAFTHVPTVDEQKAAQIRLGRDLFIEHRCEKCHASKLATPIPELAMDAPSFDEIGARRNYEWMARWILDPISLRATAHMPATFHGEKAKENAEAAAAFLASLKSAEAHSPAKEPSKEQAEAGKKLFHTLLCGACHNPPDASEVDAKKVSLKQVASKFVAGTLTDFLKQPQAHYAWIHMPRFKLEDAQREQLAAYLLVSSEPPKVSTPPDKQIVERGKGLVQKSGCLNCHAAKLENQFTTKTLAEISDWKKGCLAEKPDDKAPEYRFSIDQRDAIRAFAATDRNSLTRHVAADFAERYCRILNCRSCHGQFEGFPKFDILGDKLKPEWMAKFVAGDVNYKPRPWLESQMPAFLKFADPLSRGLSTQHGLPPQSPDEAPSDQERVKIGHRLVSNPPQGFACISCHSIGSFGATQVFEAPGINLMHSGERLQRTFFKRWLRNPPVVDPQTKMPAYFDDEGKSPIAEVYEGDAYKQIDALWEYIRLGDKMPPPNP